MYEVDYPDGHKASQATIAIVESMLARGDAQRHVFEAIVHMWERIGCEPTGIVHYSHQASEQDDARIRDSR
jgi:UV DNA damage repair endonuclease